MYEIINTNIMNIFTIILILLMLYSIKDFKHAFFVFILFNIVLNGNINIINSPNLPKLSVDTFGLMWFSFLAIFVKQKRKNQFVRSEFPYKKSFALCILSICISTILSTVGFATAITRALQEILSNYIIIVLMWKYIVGKEDVVFILKGFTFLLVLLCVYGIFEKIFHVNPLIEYEIGLNPEGRSLNWRYSDDNRLGMGRVQSAVAHPIGFGIYICAYLYITWYIKICKIKIWSLPVLLQTVVFILAFSCLFFINTRSPLIYLIIISFPYFNIKKKYMLNAFKFVFAFSPLLVIIIVPYFDNFLSLFKSNINVGGSSIEMRMRQFDAAYALFKNYLVFGLGVKSINLYLGFTYGILGAESIWIQLLIERGVFGAITYLILIHSFFKNSIFIKKKYLSFFVLGWLVLNSITSIPGSGQWFFGLCIILLNRLSEISDMCEVDCI